MTWRALAQAIPTWLTGLAVSTPIIAIIQGGLLLYEYRSNHGNAPRPEMPSRGIVVGSSLDPNSYSISSDDEDFFSQPKHNHNSSVVSTSTSVTSFLSAKPTKQRQSQSHQQPPLRLLVIGDSLAAGVGMSQSSTPILPESIAMALSKSMGERAIYWTCVGTPGMSSWQVVQEIHQLQQLSTPALLPIQSKLLLQRFQDWQFEQRQLVQDRLLAAQRRAQEWLEHRHDDDDMVETEEDSGHEPDNMSSSSSPPWWDKIVVTNNKRVMGWWRYLSKRVQRDWEGLRHVFQDHDYESSTTATSTTTATSNVSTDKTSEARSTIASDDGHVPLADPGSASITSSVGSSLQRKLTRLQRCKTLDHDFIQQYDIVIVITGLNDLKDAWLPFMMSTKRKRLYQEVRQQHSSTGTKADWSIKEELLLILHTLQDKMKIQLPGSSITTSTTTSTSSTMPSNDEKDETNDVIASSGDANAKDINTTTKEASSMLTLLSTTFNNTSEMNSTQRRQQQQQHKRQVPLVVFPAIPIEPIKMIQYAPIGWFVAPWFRTMDQNKQILSEMYPDLVVYVEAPSQEVFRDVEAKRGPLWDDLQQEHVLFNITDVMQGARERIEGLMKEHYRTWVRDAEDEEDFLYEIDMDGICTTSTKGERNTHPGATMISIDGIHPNDNGYEIWGRYIANGIIQHLDRRS